MSYPTVPLEKLVTSLRNGLSPSTKGQVPGEVLTLSAVTQGRYDDGYRKEATFDRPPADDQIARPGMLLICRGNGNINLVGAGVIVPEGAREVIFPDTVIGAQLNCDAIDTHYLRHAWASRAIRSQVEASARTTNGTHKVNQKSLGAIDVPVPPLDAQRRIAAILDKADGIRRKRREAIAMTEELRSTFLEMFGDPVTNPKGWPTVQMGAVVRESQYGTSTKANEDGRGLRILRMNNVTADGRVDLSEIKWVELEAKEVPKRTVQRGDLMFNRTNSPELVGKTAVWHSDESYALAGYLVRIRFKLDKAVPDYVSGFLNSSYGKQYLFVKAKPSNNMSNFSASEFKKIPIPLPPVALQRKFAAFAARVREARGRLEAAVRVDDELFDALVQRAFAGEL